MALQDRVKAELDRMEADQVVKKVNEPAKLSSHMLVVVKKDMVRIFLDQSDLNVYQLREHYLMPT